MDSDITAALRLGWELAEARGRSWPEGPRPVPTKELPERPEHLLPLRFQRDADASRTETISTLVAVARRLRITSTDSLPEVLRAEDAEVSAADWPALATSFRDVDAYVQDELAQRDDSLANAYLLGRGLSESYWGLGPKESWAADEGASPAYLLGEPRRTELSRMLGRLGGTVDDAGHPVVHELTPAVIDGSLVAWGTVVADDDWVDADDLGVELREQTRRWYQLLVLGQDPTTLVPPGARLLTRHYLWRNLRAFVPQIALAVVALVLTTVAATGTLGSVDLVALLPGGLGALVLAGLMTRGQSLAQQAAVRLRQDAYTDLVAVHATRVPTPPDGGGVLERLERLMPERTLTPPTGAPASAASLTSLASLASLASSAARPAGRPDPG